MNPKVCSVCEAEFTPSRKCGKQETCGKHACVRTAKRLKFRAKQAAREATKNTETNVMNKDGSIKEYFLTRGKITNVNGHSCMVAGITS